MLEPGDYVRTLEVDGRSRTALVHVPSLYNPDRPAALVLAFHGGGSNGAEMVGFSGLNDKSNEAGFIVVYPSGTGRNDKFLSFNGGNCCGHAVRQQVDDVKFVRLLIEHLHSELNIDRGQVFATGMSNGAVLAYRLASEMADTLAAIAPVAGPMGTETCHPSRPVSVIHFHGTDDEFAPVEGGIGRRSLSRTKFLPVQHGLDCWIQANGCSPEPVVEQLPTPQSADMPITRRTWGGGRAGAEVVYLLVENAGHTWPGRVSTLTMLGRSTLDISANDLMWEFFQKHARRDSSRPRAAGEKGSGQS